MKIQIASDLHLEFLEKKFPDYRAIEITDTDVLVIAGDIHRGIRAITKFADWPVPVVYVHGNHEAYSEQYFSLVENLRAASLDSNVHYLERDEYVLNGVRFLGCCLWTDYRLMGNPLTAMRHAKQDLNDHRLIRTEHGRFTPQDALQIHQKSRAWLEKKLDGHFDGPTVVVTHHGSHPNSVHPQFDGSPLNPAFISDLTPLVEKADLWIHGHVHDSFRYDVAGTTVVANPRGYPNLLNVHSTDEIEWENKVFDPKLVIEIQDTPLRENNVLT